MSINRTEAIKNFLIAKTHSDLASLYNINMECQVNVLQDNGERIEGEYKGKQWHGWSDGLQVWKSFRIPYNANSEPTFDDSPIKFDLCDHADGIGMTGWDWKNKCSRWVAFDFDAISGHSEKNDKRLTPEQLQEVIDVATKIPWVTVRYSTSGRGIHLYVMLDAVPTLNHSEHAALARAILGLMSANTGFNFISKVDVCGGNMWVWHRKMKDNGLCLIKQGDVLDEAPSNWRDHLSVVTGRRKKIIPSFVNEENIDTFEELTGQRPRVKLDESHKQLIKYLEESGSSFWYDQDHHLLVAHTYDLAQAHLNLQLKGIFSTLSTGKEHGVDHNAWLVPLRHGAWIVRRFTPGVAETGAWDQDSAGYTRCYLNYTPDLRMASRANEGVEDEGDKYLFRHGALADMAATSLGISLEIPPGYAGRPATLRMHKDGRRLIAEFDRTTSDRQDDLVGWLPTKRNNLWRRIFTVPNAAIQEPEVSNYDDLIRHLVTEEGSDYGWTVKCESKWHSEPLVHVKPVLESMGTKALDVKVIIGSSVFKPWTVVNRPFQPEYIGNRQWNKDAAQFRYIPNLTKEVLTYPTWLLILNHIGISLDTVVREDTWCSSAGLKSGADYLKCWIAALFQQPTEPLPYLFLYGPQGSGKSILHEALNLLLTSGYQRADAALKSSSGFNGELKNAVLCVIEETDLKKNKQAYNKIKDWVTSLQLPIRELYRPSYLALNTTHWIQCSNERTACPVFPGDTRITMIYVGDLTNEIPKRELIQLLDKEAPDFLAEILKLELPRSLGRLTIPVLATSDKESAEKANQTLLEAFIDECCHYIPGSMITIAEFYDAFVRWLEPNDRYEWTKIRVSRELPQQFLKGRNPMNAQWCYGNISFEESKEPKQRKLVLYKEKLVESDT